MPYRPQSDPNEDDLDIIRRLGWGYTAVQVARRRKVTSHTIHNRLKFLYQMTGAVNQVSLVYWALNNERIEYTWQHDSSRRKKLPEPKLQVVELLARGYNQTAIGRKLSLSAWGVDRRIRESRASLGCKTQAHLVAICWTEDWIV
jgi:DNA-binding NarL/FixJ family response regulator